MGGSKISTYNTQDTESKCQKAPATLFMQYMSEKGLGGIRFTEVNTVFG